MKKLIAVLVSFVLAGCVDYGLVFGDGGGAGGEAQGGGGAGEPPLVQKGVPPLFLVPPPAGGAGGAGGEAHGGSGGSEPAGGAGGASGAQCVPIACLPPEGACDDETFCPGSVLPKAAVSCPASGADAYCYDSGVTDFTCPGNVFPAPILACCCAEWAGFPGSEP